MSATVPSSFASSIVAAVMARISVFCVSPAASRAAIAPLEGGEGLVGEQRAQPRAVAGGEIRHDQVERALRALEEALRVEAAIDLAHAGEGLADRARRIGQRARGRAAAARHAPR